MKQIFCCLCALGVLLGAAAQETTPPKFQGADMQRFMTRLVGEMEQVVDETQTPVADISPQVVVRMTVDAEGKVAAWQYLDKTCEGRDHRDVEPATARMRELLATALGRLDKWTPAMRGELPVPYTTTLTFRLPVAKIAKKQEAEPLLFLGGNPEESFFEWARPRTHFDQRFGGRGIEGLVHVRFYIEPDGRIAAITVVQTPDDKLSREVIRVIRSSKGKWTPRKIDGVPQRTAFDYRVNFLAD